MAMSLDVIYNFLADSVFDLYMHNLFDSAERYVLLNASYQGAEISEAHVRHRNSMDGPRRTTRTGRSYNVSFAIL